MNKYTETCIGISYICSSESFYMRNIPESIYYLKIIFGKDLRKHTQEGQCIVKSVLNALYEKRNDEPGFYKIKEQNTIDGNDEYSN